MRHPGRLLAQHRGVPLFAGQGRATHHHLPLAMKRATTIATAAMCWVVASSRPAGAVPIAEEPAASPAPGPASGVPALTPSAAMPAAASLPSDHDLVVGHLGVDARRIAAVPYPLTLTRTGCPSVPPAPSCT